jgi:hypothetical protein
MSCLTCGTKSLPRDSWCTACERVQYCGKECQLRDWNVHQLECGGDIGKEYWMQDAVKHPGAFTRAKDRYNRSHHSHMSTKQFASHELHDPHASATMKRRANLARTFAKYRGHHSRHYGSVSDDDDEGYRQKRPHKHFFEASLF